MATNCNRLVEDLSPSALDAKASAAGAASVAVCSGVSDCYRAIELAHHGLASPIDVYLQAAAEKFAEAIRALAEVDTILRSAPLTAEALTWTRHLDFERLYAEGTRLGVIAPHREQWSRLEGMLKDGKVLSISNVLADDLSAVRDRIERVLQATESESAQTNRVGVPFAVLSLQSGLLTTIAFAQMVAFVNTLEPLDPDWLTSATRTADMRAASLAV